MWTGGGGGFGGAGGGDGGKGGKGGEGGGGGGERNVPASGASTVATVGAVVTVMPAGRSELATVAELIQGAMLASAALAAACVWDAMVIARLTDAAVTSRDTSLTWTCAALATLALIPSCTACVKSLTVPEAVMVITVRYCAGGGGEGGGAEGGRGG